ncbi:hypothetical protein [Streptomyces sp. SS07]|nr:hypothetical protein [Streptomyces sp. SS07]
MFGRKKDSGSSNSPAPLPYPAPQPGSHIPDQRPKWGRDDKPKKKR